jgi:uncharacterized protein YecT (DUF1311 family)
MRMTGLMCSTAAILWVNFATMAFSASANAAPAHVAVKSVQAAKAVDSCNKTKNDTQSAKCVSIDPIGQKSERSKRFQTLTSSYGAKEKAAFAKLSAAAVAFREARSQYETDQTSLSRSATILAEEEVQDLDFFESFEKFEQNKAPTYTPTELRKENKLMNQSFVKLMKAKDTSTWGSITKDKIIKTQKAWVAYRNAWLEFAKLRHPGLPTDSIDAWFTEKRNHMFDSLLNSLSVK